MSLYNLRNPMWFPAEQTRWLAKRYHWSLPPCHTPNCSILLGCDMRWVYPEFSLSWIKSSSLALYFKSIVINFFLHPLHVPSFFVLQNCENLVYMLSISIYTYSVCEELSQKYLFGHYNTYIYILITINWTTD